MNFLLLDISKTIVWASNAGGRSTGVKALCLRPGENSNVRFRRCEEWLTEMAEKFGYIDFIICIMNRRGHESLANAIDGFAAERNIVVHHYGAYLKRRACEYATGEKMPDEQQVIRAARVFGWSPTDYREAVAGIVLEQFLDIALDGF